MYVCVCVCVFNKKHGCFSSFVIGYPEVPYQLANPLISQN